MSIATVLLLEDMGANYHTIRSFTVEAIVGGDSCLPVSSADGQCCVTRNLAAESQFGVNSSYLYGVVDLPDGPSMRQTHVIVGHPGYVLNRAEYTQNGDTALRKNGNPMSQPLRMFQFIVGEFRFSFVHLHADKSIALLFQTKAFLIQLTQLPLVTPHPFLLSCVLVLPLALHQCHSQW